MKDALAILVVKGKPSEGKAPDSSGALPEDGSVSAAKRILDAIESKDATALDDALQDHYASCEEAHEAESE